MAHLSDRDLLMEFDGELDTADGVEIRQHLDGCPECRERQSAIVRTMQEAVNVYMERDVPPAAAARAQLRNRLQSRRAFRYAAAAAVCAVIAIFAAGLRPSREEGPRPRAAITPGAVVPISVHSICAPDAETAGPTVTVQLANEVFRDYGVEHPLPGSFEIDYLIPAGLGGSADRANLWPQPYNAGIWNARVKDALEDRLQAMVCSGTMELEAAQRAIATDWIAAYKKYFRTAEPLPDHVAFRKDPPWQ